MIFTEFRFLFFFVVVFVIRWMLRDLRAQKLWLLLCSYVFYAAWDWRFLSLIWISTAVDYLVGLRLGAEAEVSRRKLWVTASVVTNLSILGIFKYYNFFAESLTSLLSLLGLPVSYSVVHIVLPVGISFYTFQTMSYSLDIYRGRLEPTRSLLDLALFVGFFPQLVAGPIVRARAFLPQLDVRARFQDVDFRSSLVLFMSGYFKKACVSDNIAPYVDRFFAAPDEFTALSAWTAVLLYAAQIYCDFSGYSEMAIACARMLGFELGENFNFPYLATSIKDFWRRWHISLSSWLRDYLYISLGGNRGSTLFTYRNLMLTMLLGGLWHGASWNFVIWGGLHGAALIAHRLWEPFGRRLPTAFSGGFGFVLTMWWVNLAWIFFRAADLGEAMAVTRSYVLFIDNGPRELGPGVLWLLLVLAVLHVAGALSHRSSWWRRAPGWAFAAAYGLLAALALSLVHPAAQPFIYFQF
ncbi:MAG: MBOAT family O-acyltransferase [Thermoanaerobaculales bacterium]|jgi:alginate O-acetyltransferase complex protein AlgI|nr:MBOAT family O-acyltransferase [Thermoanaerobaculales bacterium]